MSRMRATPGVSSSPRVQPPQTLVEAERAHVTEAFEQAGWVAGGTSGAAARLGIARTTLISLMKRLGIERDRNRNFIRLFHLTPKRAVASLPGHGLKRCGRSAA
jgi:DNA-binding NtrC family response regulator